MIPVIRRSVTGRTVNAYHEAGHAVAARALGFEAVAHLGREGNSSGRTHYFERADIQVGADAWMTAAAVRSLAGPIAEHLAALGDAGTVGTPFRGVTVTPLSAVELRRHLRVLRGLAELRHGSECDYGKAAFAVRCLGKKPSWLLVAASRAQRILIDRWAEVEEERRQLMRRARGERAQFAHSQKAARL